jgi:SAM-dependent methyltransferase
MTASGTMSGEQAAYDARQIAELAAETEATAAAFLDRHHADLEQYRAHLSAGIKLAKDRLADDVAEISGEDPLCVQLVRRVGDYVDWLQWSLWDLPSFAVAIRPEPRRFERRVAACAMVYFAGRVIDDVIDRHFWYKAKRPTLLAVVADSHPSATGVEVLTVLTGLLLCAEGLLRLTDPEDADHLLLLERVLGSFRRAVVGAIMEQNGGDRFTPDRYERLIHLKNVDFWRCLYSALDPQRASPLYPFLEAYYALAQKLNDVQDFPEDQRRNQPNLLSLHLGRPGAAEEHLGARFLELAERARALPPVERRIALSKLGESLREAFRLGLFAAARPPPPPAAPAPEPAPLGLHWYSTLAEVTEAAGAGGLEDVACGVCGGRERRRMFEKQGFAYHRCLDCSHVYVSPRLRADLQLRLGEERAGDDEDNDFLEVQSIFAEPICHLLRLRARGTRLLDVGFGRGYILKLARAYGFEAYGVDSSGALVRDLEPQLGRRVVRTRLGVDAVPWGAFDVIVMTHVAEHLGDPAAVLRELRAKLNPGGILYVAVPDIESLQFKIFGKTWDVVSPIAHVQYFNEQSLSRLLAACDFTGVERIQHPPLPRELTPKWMRLLRKLGGDESGELAMIARRPREAA